MYYKLISLIISNMVDLKVRTGIKKQRMQRNGPSEKVNIHFIANSEF